MHGMESPAMIAARKYLEIFGDKGEEIMTFGQMLEAYFVNGYVVATPEYFICARPVRMDADPDDIINPVYPFVPGECNAWFVGLMAGDPRLIWTYCPITFEYCGYQRDGSSLRWFETERIRRKIMGSGPKVKDPEPAPPPPSVDNKDVELAARQARANRADRKGYKSTLLASGQNNASQAGTKSLLG